MVIDKNLLANVPLWIPSLDANNMFDRVNSDSLWKGLLHPLGNFLYKMGEGRRFTQNHFVRKNSKTTGNTREMQRDVLKNSHSCLLLFPSHYVENILLVERGY